MDFWGRPWNQTPEQSLEIADIVMAEEKQDSQNQKSVRIITFFDVRSDVHSIVLRQDQIINQLIYKKASQSAREETRVVIDKSWLLHQDNAPALNAKGIEQFLTERNITILEQTPLSSDLAPCDFFFFSNSKGSSWRPVLKAYRSSREPYRRS